MDPLIGAALVGGIGSLLGGVQQNHSAREAAREQMAFQKESAQHSYQWGMEDMRKAGLNPILAYKQGGSGTLSGSSYTPQNIGEAAVRGAAGASSSAVQQARQKVELANIAADTALKGSQDSTQDALRIQALAQAGQATATTAVAVQDAQNRVLEGDLLRESLIQTLPKSKIAEADLKFWGSAAAGPLLATRRLMESLSPGINSAANLARGVGR